MRASRGVQILCKCKPGLGSITLPSVERRGAAPPSASGNVSVATRPAHSSLGHERGPARAPLGQIIMRSLWMAGDARPGGRPGRPGRPRRPRRRLRRRRRRRQRIWAARAHACCHSAGLSLANNLISWRSFASRPRWSLPAAATLKRVGPYFMIYVDAGPEACGCGMREMFATVAGDGVQ